MSCKEIVNDVLNFPNKIEIWELDLKSKDTTLYYGFFYKDYEYRGLVFGESKEEVEADIKTFDLDRLPIVTPFLESIIYEFKQKTEAKLIKTIDLNQ